MAETPCRAAAGRRPVDERIRDTIRPRCVDRIAVLDVEQEALADQRRIAQCSITIPIVAKVRRGVEHVTAPATSNVAVW